MNTGSTFIAIAATALLGIGLYLIEHQTGGGQHSIGTFNTEAADATPRQQDDG